LSRATRSARGPDRWAERSQRFSLPKAGRFVEEIVAIDISGRKGAQHFDTDEANRPDTTMEILAKLKPAFRRMERSPPAMRQG
jgi:acetyl-CoA C-acetyltransferase